MSSGNKSMGFNLFFPLIIFIFGLAVGSFLNCVIYRLETDENTLEGRPQRKTLSFLRGRSYCPHCKHILSWQDLIPILSFLTLKGKCRYCKEEISWQYPLVEISTALIFLLIFNSQFSIFNQQLTIFSIFNTCFLFLVSCFLIIIFVYDLKHYIIPDEVIYPAIGLTFIYNIISYFLLNTSYPILNTMYSAFAAAIFFLFIFLLSRGKWLGFGDVKLTFFIGLFLNFPNVLVALFLAFSIGAIIGIGLIFAGKKSLKSKVPFGPFLVVGTFIALFFGNKIVNWYLNILNLTP